MPEREKVIEALRICRENLSTKSCRKCPYMRGRDGTGTCYPIDAEENGVHLCWEDLVDDALALLKEQEPRVMTWDDVLEFAKSSDVGYSEKTPCYIEYFEPEPRFIKWGDAETIYKWVYSYITGDERRRLYNRNDRHGWRLWTARPSEQQMRDTPWKGDSDAE